jgi:multidrug transporter EmrE-like cation transporter
MIDGRTLLLILGAVASSAAGQILLKVGARHLAGSGQFAFLLAAAREPRILAGLTAWVASTICWLYALRAAPLARAYGRSSLTYLLVPLASACLLGEPLRRPHLLGMALIVAGVACLLVGE